MKKILVLNFFPAFTPPASGGELRYFNIYKKLSKYYDITLLSPTYNDAKVEIIEHSSSFREYRIPKEDIHNEIHWELEKKNFSPEFSALTCAYSGQHHNLYHDYYLKLYNEMEIIIHDSPYMLYYDLFFGIDNKIRIYNSYNLEYELLEQIYKGKNANKHLQFIKKLESQLIEKCDMVFATSEREKQGFVKLYNCRQEKIKLAPNGINPEEFPERDAQADKTTAFFIGSGHPPNIEAVNFIIDYLADSCSDITFLIAGSCCDGIDCKKQNVVLHGRVNEEEKEKLFKTSNISINPMFSGAGTNLKTLEYLSMGIPMISTSTGVRGLELEDSKHFMLADKDNFSKQLKKLATNNQLQQNISKKAKKLINIKFNWSRVSEDIYHEIELIEPKKNKTLFLLNDFEVSSPFGGGEVRINKLYAELSKSYNVLLVCLNNSGKIKKTWITDNFLELSIPKSVAHLKEEAKINTQYWVSASDIVAAYMIEKNDLYISISNILAQSFDITVLSHPYMYNTLRHLSINYLIYESLNHELSLKQELLGSHPSRNKLLDTVKNIESESCINSDLIISVADTDHKRLMQYLPKSQKEIIITIRNGVEISYDEPLFQEYFSNVKALFSGHPLIIFIGSAHMPNIDSAKYIINTLAKEQPDCIFIIIGSVCNAITGEKIPSNILLFGKLDETHKNVLLSIADIAINPMFWGSGSNLKLAEYFSWALPTVTTPSGARGYDIEDGSEAVICNISQFSSKITQLLTNKQIAQTLKENALLYARSHLDWKILGKQYKNILDNKVFAQYKKKLLIITYRFTTPPLGGAEVYFYELIKELDKTDKFDITIAYINTHNIENLYHFSTKISSNSNFPNNDFKNVTLKSFSFDEINEKDKIQNSRILMRNWVNEFLYSARKFLPYYKHPLILGGWNFPEKTGDQHQLWSSRISEIYVENVNKIILRGISPNKKTLVIKADDNIMYHQSVCGNFSIKLDISAFVLSLECEIETIEPDIRSLGVLITSIEIDLKNLSLEYCYRDFLKNHFLDIYVNELIDIATTRDPEYDNIFQETRGISSSMLEKYLDQNISEFDYILGHSIPFKTTVITAKYAIKHKKPYSLLPHFHFDDEFYHWKSYYNALENADNVFASPTVSIKIFYNKLGINTITVPGGGINPEEYNNLNHDNFSKLYTSQKPFFLTLGRKSGAKNYTSIIDAINKINEKEHICNLIMIGRDEDGEEINSNFVIYLNEQHRSVVLSAIQKSIGVVTMSKSESFGIVIIEAWMFKKPVVINSECPAFVELVSDRVDGLYASKENLVDCLLNLLEDEPFSKKLGINGHKKTADYTWHSISNIFEVFLKGNINEKSNN